MTLHKIHRIIAFKHLFWLLFALAACIQFIIILYNHISGFFLLQGPGEFLNRWIWGTLLSLIGAFLLAYPDLAIIRWLNLKYQWGSYRFYRIFMQLIMVLIVALVVSTVITSLSHLIGNFKEGLPTILVTNGLIFSVINILLTILLEAWLFFLEGSESRKWTEKLEKELSQVRFEVLKNQINPHFMFNSLNVLSGLIETDTGKAQQFVDEFSSVYRYVVETIEKHVVTLGEELEFARSYMFLQKIRYGKHLNFEVDLLAGLSDYFMPPLSLQVALENAIKHNLVNAAQPLYIEVYSENSQLIIRNNIQLKIATGKSTGIGQKNLVKRYALISENGPRFKMTADHYLVYLPLIPEDNEDSDH